MQVALAVAWRGEYAEVDWAGYARATGGGDGMASFAPALGTWGVVRAWGLVDDAGLVRQWVALAVPLLVAEGQQVVLDIAAGTLGLMDAGARASPSGGPLPLTARAGLPPLTGGRG